MSWSSEEVDRKLREIMERIHEACVIRGEREEGSIDYVRGANLAGFERVAEAMLAHGAV